jgi:sarcosine oxidase, subunit beta
MGNAHIFDSRLIELNARSLEAYKHFNHDFGDFSARIISCGSILVATTDEVASRLEKQAKLQNGYGIQTELLDSKGERIHQIAPYLSTENVRGAIYCPGDGMINQAGVVNSFRVFAYKHGVNFFYETRVTGITMEGNNVTGIRTESARRGKDERFEDIETAMVVNAAGALAGEVASWANVSLPVKNEPRTLWDIGVLAGDIYTRVPIVEILDGPFNELYIKPGWGNGRINVAGRTESLAVVLKELYDLGAITGEKFDNPAMGIPPREIGKRTTLDFLKDFFPTLKLDGALPWGGHTGVRSLSYDGLPLLGPASGREGLVNQCGMSGYGVTSALETGRLVARNVIEGKPPPEMEAFLPSAERFGVGGSPEME